VVWGGLHGLYLVVNHAWRHVTARLGLGTHPLLKLGSGLLTFLAVCFAWVYFRAPSLAVADTLALSMLGLHGGGSPVPGLLWSNAVLSIGVGLGIVFLLPNTQSFIETAGAMPTEPIAGTWRWQPRLRWAVYIGLLAALSSYTGLWSQSTIHEFIYYRF
jgi:alginate O-acetyltransferase complex protein AlgI